MAAVVFFSCTEKTTIIEHRLLKEQELSLTEATFMVLVDGAGIWSASSGEDWIHIDERYYTGEAAFEVRCDSNESTEGDHRFCRVGRVLVNAWDGSWTGEVIIRQDGLSPEIELSPVLIAASEGVYSMPMKTNLSDRERKGLSFSCDAQWISDMVFGQDGKSIVFKATAGNSRSAEISVTFTDAWGRTYTKSAKINQ